MSNISIDRAHKYYFPSIFRAHNDLPFFFLHKAHADSLVDMLFLWRSY